MAHKQRRIHLTYSVKNDRWYVFDLKNLGLARTLYIPKKEITMNGLKDEVGIKTFGGIYIYRVEANYGII